ncbi:MAG: helix-turn-helix domain-containing protein [Coriobacteriia bacterium]|nr:helix-turn-helix domain-containing protein [Coriobacteriia bacterium]
MGIHDEPELLTVAQAANLLQVSERTIHRHIAAGSLPAHKFFGQWRIPRSAIERGIESALSGSEER